MTTLEALYYCFGIVIPTITLLFNYGAFAFQIGEYNLEAKKTDSSIPIIIILLLTKLFLISFVMFFIYYYTFDNEIFDNKVVTIKCLLWGLLISVDNFILTKELNIVCKHLSSITYFRKYIYKKFTELYQQYKLLFYIKCVLIALLILCFVFSIFTGNISFITLLLALYVYYNVRINIYTQGLKKYSDENKSEEN